MVEPIYALLLILISSHALFLALIDLHRKYKIFK